MRRCIVLCLVFFNIAAFATNPFTVKKAELTRVTSQIHELQQNIILDQKEQQNIEEKLQVTETTIGELGEQINTLNLAIIKEQQRLAKLEKTQQLSLQKLMQQKAALSQQLRMSYQVGQAQSLKVIFNHDDTNTLQRHLVYYHHLTETRLQLINDTKQLLANLKTIMQSMSQHQQNLKALLTAKQAQQNEQQQAQSHRQNLLTMLHQNVQTKQEQLTSLVTNQQALQEIVTHLKQQASSAMSGKPFSQMRSKLQWPIKGRIIANFGSPLDVGDQRLTGVVIKAPEGTPVHAISSGKVIFANWLRGFGLLIIINHNNDYMSLYGRNHALYVKVGSQVNIGDVIATTGNSGGFEKSSLYFEIRRNGSPVNPSVWCR
ncbi:MAG: murein hydrolase activator EnvC family protein [Gammaproteobacteria bacterium]